MTVAAVTYAALGLATATLTWRLIMHAQRRPLDGIALLALAAIALLWPAFLALALTHAARNPKA